MRFAHLALVAASALPFAPDAARAAAPPPPPMLALQGRDQVLIGRVYWRQSGQTQAVARFGMVIADAPRDEVIEVSTDGGAYALTVGSKRTGERGAKVTWTLRPTGAAALPPAEGRLEVSENSVGHVPLGSSERGELFASIETGRASTFHVQRLWDHFGVVTDAARFAAAAAERQSAPAPAGGASIPSAGPAPRGGTMTLTCAGGGSYELSTGSGHGRCDATVDGDRMTSATCDDGGGNLARATCTINAGRGGCLSISGTASCRELR